MGTALKKHYITASMVAERWNSEKYPGPNKDGKWDGDAVVRKLRRLFERVVREIDKYIKEQGESGESNEEQDKLRELYISKWRGGKKGEWVFFDTNDIGEIAMNIKSALNQPEEGGLSETVEIPKEWFSYYDQYGMDEYDPKDTYDTLKWIFDLLEDNKELLLTSEENAELEQMLVNLLPWTMEVDELNQIANVEEKGQLTEEDKAIVIERWERYSKGWTEINAKFDQYYIVTRDDIFFEKRLFDDRECVRGAQYKALGLWKRKWVYVMDQILRIRSKEPKGGTGCIPVKEIVKCAVVWHLKEGDELKVVATYNKDKDYLQQCKELILDIVSHDLRKSEYKNDYKFVIEESFLELEKIREFLGEESDSIEPEKEESAYLTAIRYCIDLISPSREGRTKLAP